MNRNFLVGIVILVVVIGAGFFAYQRFGLFGGAVAEVEFPQDSYHAVFLSNNQVYFGKVQTAGPEFLKLNEIYYLILKRPLQQQTPPEGGEQPKPEYTVVKLGNELHGPKDEMIINREQVLFIEELKSDSKVVTAITEFQNKKAEQAEGGE